MDEILVADFMVFHDAIADRPYDLVIGDEAWEVDYFLHENPELKRFAYCGSRTSSAGSRCPRRPAGPSFTCRSSSTSSSPSTCTIACKLTGPAGGWTSAGQNPTGWPRP
jgi:hypothetical protein